MAVESGGHNGLHFSGVFPLYLLIAGRVVFGDTSLTINPQFIILEAVNGSYDKKITITCSIQEDLTQMELSLWQDTPGKPGWPDTPTYTKLVYVDDDNDEAQISDDLTQHSSKYSATGSKSKKSITLNINNADCKDVGLYKCVANGDDSNPTFNRLILKPIARNFTWDPNIDPSQIKANDQLILTCEAIVGSVFLISDEDEQLEEKFRTKIVFGFSAKGANLAFQNLVLKQEMKETENCDCSIKQTITVDYKVNRERDTQRILACGAKVVEKKDDVNEFNLISISGFDSLEFPILEPESTKGLSIGAIIGICLGAAALVMICTFLIYWAYSRRIKRGARKTEIEQRKAAIDQRRKSIASIVESRKSSFAPPGAPPKPGAPSADPSSAAASSVVPDSSSAAPSEASSAAASEASSAAPSEASTATPEASSVAPSTA